MTKVEELIKRLEEWGGVDAFYNGEYVEVDYHGLFELLDDAATMLQYLVEGADEINEALEKMRTECCNLRRKKESDEQRCPCYDGSGIVG